MAKSATMNGRQAVTLDPDGAADLPSLMPERVREIAPPPETPLDIPIERTMIEVPLLDSPETLYRAEHIDVRLIVPEQRIMMTRLLRGLSKVEARLNPTEQYPMGQRVENPPQCLKWMLEELGRSIGGAT